jgi:hypothetical protein
MSEAATESGSNRSRFGEKRAVRDLDGGLQNSEQTRAVDLDEDRLHRAESESDASARFPLVNVAEKVELNSIGGAFQTLQDGVMELDPR